MRNIAFKVNRYLIDREYSPLYHLIAVIIILAAASLLFYKNFQVHGTMMATDMTWPPLNRIQLITHDIWYPYGSVPTVGSLQYFYWIYPTAAVARLLHLSSAQYQFLMFYGTFSLAGISMYVLAFKTIRSIKLPDAARYAPYAGAVFAGIVYMYNPWSIQYLRPYFAYPLYALLPLLFLAMVKTFDFPTMRNIILFSLFAVLINTNYQLTWLLGLLFTYLVYYLIVYRFERERLLKAVKAFAGIAVFFLLLNATWLLPTVGAQLTGRPFVPFYAPDMTKAAVNGMSAINSLTNNFRLVSVWPGTLIDTLKGGTLLGVILFALPLFSILALLVIRKRIKQNRMVNYWAMMALISLLLATGTSFVLRRPYEYFTLNAPGSHSYGWMLRMSERWQFFIPIFFAMILGMLLAVLLARRPRESERPEPFLERIREGGNFLTGRRSDGLFPRGDNQLDSWTEVVTGARLVAAFIMIVLILASFFPVTAYFAQNVYNPAPIPKDYDQINRFFASQSPEMRVVWLPFFPPESYNYSWAPEKRVGTFSVSYSNPSLSDFQEVMNANSYFNWLQNLYRKDVTPDVGIGGKDIMIKKDILTALLTPFGAKYAIYDNSVNGYDFGDAFQSDKSLELAKRTRYLAVYETAYNPGLIWAATRTVIANSFFDNLALAQQLSRNEMQNLAFTDGGSYSGGNSSIGGKYGAVGLGKHMQLASEDPGFQQVDENGALVHWSRFAGDQRFGVELGARKIKKGRQGIKIVNNSTQPWDLAWMIGGEIPVQESEIYAFQTDVKYRNANWTTAQVEGYQTGTGQWIYLASAPNIRIGEAGWKQYYVSFRVPGGISKIRPRLGGGWSAEKTKGPGLSWFDNTRVSRLDPQFYKSIAPSVKPPSITSRKVTSEKYQVHVNDASKPFVLAFGEAYDKHWVMRAPRGKTIRSVPLYSTINGFPIEDTGNYDVTIEFEPQHQADFGLAISLITVAFSLLFLLYNWRKKRPFARHSLEATGGIDLSGPLRNLARELARRPDW